LSNTPDGGEERLAGQVAIVTGGGRGVGRAIALELAAAGAAVTVSARSREEIAAVAGAISEAGGRAIAIPADVADEEAVRTLVEETESWLGPPTLLVANAGVWRHVGPLAEADPDEWWGDVEVSVRGTFLTVRAALPGMLARGRGRIVAVSSNAAIAPRPYATAYACAKAAVLRLIDSLAGELAGTGVLAFTITPGFVRTELVEAVAASEAGRRYLPELAGRDDGIEPERAGRLVADIASGRLDALAGRFLHVLDDVDELLRRSEEIDERRLYALRLDRLDA
jgi:NAD(P)-dependent dehydrogenase (short-subunit alcohol dehydrogenase family)